MFSDLGEVLIGVPPEGFEFVSYLLGFFLAIIFVKSVIYLFTLVLKILK